MIISNNDQDKNEAQQAVALLQKALDSAKLEIDKLTDLSKSVTGEINF